MKLADKIEQYPVTLTFDRIKTSTTVKTTIATTSSTVIRTTGTTIAATSTQ